MAQRITQVEKDLMWELYKKYGNLTKVAEIMGRSRSAVTVHIRAREAAINAARVVMEAQNTPTEE